MPMILKQRPYKPYSENYLEIPKTVVIWILGFNMFQDGNYHEIARVKRDFNNEELIDKIEYHYIQLPKFLEQVKEIKNKEEQWLAYFTYSLNKDELRELFDMNKSIEEINKIVDIVMTDDDVMNALNERILADNLEKLKRVKAFKDGKKENQIEISKKMIQKEIDNETISQLTGLALEEVIELKERN